MSQWCNEKSDYALGAIVRLKLEHFVTYDSLEFSPGANLNVIIGPNGTGKSSIVCAICLGMGGKPSVLGRAGNISEFIKYGRSKASIEMELNNTSGKNYIIKRFIFKDNKTEWYLNERSVKFREIEDLISGLDIQVNNLCQFLPQEKVSEFARLNTYELLESTEKAVGGNELWEKHTELKENSKESRELDREVMNIEESLRKEEAINARLDSQVSSYLEKKKFEESLQWLKRKLACLAYSERRKNYEATKKEKDHIFNDLTQLNKHLEPLEEKKSKIELHLKKQKDILAIKSHKIQECSGTGRALSTRFNELTEKVNEVKSDYVLKENEVKERKATIQKLSADVETIRVQYEEAKQGQAEIQQKEVAIRERDLACSQEIEKLMERQYEKNNEAHKLQNQLQALSSQLERIKSVREDKLNKLKSSPHVNAYKAILWLDANRDLFEGQVFEPMFLLINVKSNQAARYVEQNISNKDLCSMFLFEHSKDMHLFMSEVRDKQNLVVNSAIVPGKKSSEFKPLRPIEELQAYGFHSYLRDLIDAPEQVLQYLCVYAQIHNIPLGNEYTQKNIAEIMPKISDFQRIYTNSHCYSFTRSRYTGKTSSTSFEVGNGYWLNSSIDASKIEQLEMQRKEIEISLQKLSKESNYIGQQKAEHEKRLESSRAERLILRERQQFIENAQKKFQFNFKKLQALKNERTELFADAAAKAQHIAEIAKKRSKITAEYVTSAQNLLSLNKDKFMATYLDTQYQMHKRKIESELREYIGRKLELEAKIETIDQRIKQAKDEAKQALENASRINEIQLEKGIPDTHKKRFGELPDTIEEIESEIHKCEAISSVSLDVDERVIEEFKKREKQIEKMTKEFERKKQKLENQRSNYEELKNSWLEQVENIIQGINEKFNSLFRQLKCSGEVELRVPEIPDDFSKYGVKIMVSFRNDEQMQELTAWQQSGGEKSVSTMMYMIALQEMTKCPFRVVDEINQGMDPVNERKVFDIIVQNSCSKQFAQYFLLTPKLLPDLCFDERTNVICVFNGPMNLPHTKYNFKRFIENRQNFNKNAT